jgi:hypothetical protein
LSSALAHSACRLLPRPSPHPCSHSTPGLRRLAPRPPHPLPVSRPARNRG